MIDRRLSECLIFQKPYFGPAFRALQGEPKRHAYMKAVVELLAKAKLGGTFKVLEVGSWAGGSAITWAKAIQRFVGDGQLTCVDPWEPYFDTATDADPIYVAMNKAASSGLIYGLFVHNIRTSGTAPMISPIVGHSRIILPTLKKSDFAIVYLDGAHDFPSVQEDIRLAMDLVQEGGVLCGDDLELQAHQLEAGELVFDVESRQEYVRSKVRGCFYHPGVTRAVGDAFGDVSVWEGFWAMRKRANGWEKVDLAGCELETPEHIAAAATSDTPESEMDQNVAMIGQVAERINQHIPSYECPPDGVPELVASYHGYNIVRLGKFFYGVSHAVGEVEWSVPSAQLAKRYGQINFITTDPSAVVEGTGLKELQGHIDKLSDAIAATLLRQESGVARIARRTEGALTLTEQNTSAIEELRQRLNEAVEKMERRVGDVRHLADQNNSAIGELRQHLDGAVEKMEQWVGDVRHLADQNNSAIGELRQRLDEAVEKMERRVGDVTHLADQNNSAIGELRHHHGELASMVQKIEQNLRAVLGDNLAAIQKRQKELQLSIQEARSEIQDVKHNALVRVGSYITSSGARRGSRP